MKILLTGITGFIGSAIARALTQTTHQVMGVIRAGSNRDRIQAILPDIQIIQADLTETSTLRAWLTNNIPDLCIHSAWYAEPGQYLHSHENLACVTTTVELAKVLGSLGCKRFVGIGTCFEYDTNYGWLGETTPIDTSTLYAAAKNATQQLLAPLAHSYGMEFAWARLFYQYGPYEDRRKLVANIIGKLLHDEHMPTTQGTQIRDYLYVEDVASAIIAVAMSTITGPVNIGSGLPVSVRELVTEIAQQLDRVDLVQFGALPYRPGDPEFICANTQRLQEATDWTPRYSLAEGIAQTIKWYREHYI